VKKKNFLSFFLWNLAVTTIGSEPERETGGKEGNTKSFFVKAYRLRDKTRPGKVTVCQPEGKGRENNERKGDGVKNSL